MRAIGAVLACVAGAITLWFLWPRPAVGVQPDSAATIARLEQEVEALRSSVASSKLLAGAAAENAVAAARIATAASAAARDRAAPALPLAAPVPKELSQVEAFQLLRQDFDAEDRDATWWKGAEASAHLFLGQYLPSGSAVRALDCRRRMCRAVLFYPDQAAYEKAMENVLQPAVETWPGIVNYAPLQKHFDGSLEQEQYLFRAGQNPLGEIYADGAHGNAD